MRNYYQMTGAKHARVSDGAGRHVRYVAVLDPAPVGPRGVRLSRREFARAGEAMVYGDAVRRRLISIYALPADAFDHLFAPAWQDHEMEAV